MSDLTTFVLIRHALHRLGGGTIAGRSADVTLSPDGEAQATGLVHRLERIPLDAIYCSPLERTRQTIEPLAQRRGLDVQICEDLHEIDYGDWTGASLTELRATPGWHEWNAFRSGRRTPSGEWMLQVQARVVRRMLELRERHPGQRVALVSHGDVIKAAVAYALGSPLDMFQRIEISPASVTVVAVGDLGPWVLCVNRTERLDELPVLGG